MLQRKTKNTTDLATPVTAEPLHQVVRAELHAIVRAGGIVDHVEDLGGHVYRIHYTIPTLHTTLVEVPDDLTARRPLVGFDEAAATYWVVNA